MKFAEINKKYTEKVAQYMANGYTINAGTMRGSQGEMAHIDLTDGNEIIRVILEQQTEHDVNQEAEEWYDFDVTQIVVGRCTNKVAPNSEDSWQTIWNNDLEIISCEKFYDIRRSGFYGTKEDAMNQQRKHYARYHARYIKERKTFDDSAKEIVLRFVKKQRGCKAAKISDISSVSKIVRKYSDGSMKIEYTVVAKGNTYKLS